MWETGVVNSIWESPPYIDFGKRIDAENVRELPDGALLVPFEDGTSVRLLEHGGMYYIALDDAANVVKR
jgi:hypothetical protein